MTRQGLKLVNAVLSVTALEERSSGKDDGRFMKETHVKRRLAGVVHGCVAKRLAAEVVARRRRPVVVVPQANVQAVVGFVGSAGHHVQGLELFAHCDGAKPVRARTRPTGQRADLLPRQISCFGGIGRAGFDLQEQGQLDAGAHPHGTQPTCAQRRRVFVGHEPEGQRVGPRRVTRQAFARPTFMHVQHVSHARCLGF